MAKPGYDYAHQKRREQLLPYALGTMCPLGLPGCDGLMVNRARMHLDHSQPIALGGRVGDRIVCAHCNTSAGASLGNRLRRRRGSQDW